MSARVPGTWRAALAAGVLVQAGLLVHAHAVPRPLVGDEAHYWTLAREIASGANPAPDFVWPPLYSWLLAGSVRLFGETRLGVELLQSLLYLATGLLLRALLLRGGVPRRAADAALFLFVVDLEAAAFAQFFWPEVVFLFLALAGTWLLLRADEPGAPACLGSGAAFGAALLAKSIVGPFVPVLALTAAVRGGGPAKRRVLRAGLFAGGFAAVALPVALSNLVNHGAFVIAPIGPFNAWVGLNDPRSVADYDGVPAAELPRYLASGATPAERNREAWRKVRAKLESEGLLSVAAGQLRKQYFRLFDKDSYFTDQLPGGRLANPSAAPLAGDHAARWAAWGIAAGILLLAALGIAAARGRDLKGAFALPALWLAFNLAVFFVAHVKTRYRIAFLPALLAFAALAVARAPERPWRGWRLAAGVALAALALFLAFGGPR